MKFYLYAIGLAMLPVVYIGVTLMNGEAIDWQALGLMALILLPIIFFAKRISAAEKQFNAMSGQDQAKVVGKLAKTVVRGQIGGD